jgi:hypothetical protein
VQILALEFTDGAGRRRPGRFALVGRGLAALVRARIAVVRVALSVFAAPRPVQRLRILRLRLALELLRILRLLARRSARVLTVRRLAVGAALRRIPLARSTTA